MPPAMTRVFRSSPAQRKEDQGSQIVANSSTSTIWPVVAITIVNLGLARVLVLLAYHVAGVLVKFSIFIFPTARSRGVAVLLHVARHVQNALSVELRIGLMVYLDWGGVVTLISPRSPFSSTNTASLGKKCRGENATIMTITV